MRYETKTIIGGKLKNIKHLEIYLKVGVVSLLVFIFLVVFIGVKTKEFDARIEAEIEFIHKQIAEEKYREVYLQSGKKLIISFDAGEFEALLRAARPLVFGKVKKGCTTEYSDMSQRLRRNLFLSFRLETYCRTENETGKSQQYFDWRITNGEMKLIWFKTEPLKTAGK